MTWISLVCLLALSSTVFGRSIRSSGYGGYGSTRVLPAPVDSYGSTRVLPPVSSYGSTRVLPSVNNYGSTRVLPSVSNYGSTRFLPAPVDNYGSTRVLSLPAQTGYGYSAPFAPQMTRTLPVSSYGGFSSSSRLLDGFDRSIEVVPQPPTQADILCRGQQPETVIPIENNRKFIVCLDDGKGVEQICPSNLIYHEQLRRCERKLGPLDDWCLSQPCLNGGQCVSGEHTFQCQCPSGFDGIVCELDARICQLNRPCGSDPSVRCQSFRAGAALQWICVSDDDSTYGPDGQHVHQSACNGLSGPHALAYTSAGFIMCDGARSHYESCPGGLIWEGLNKACVWPDMEEGITDTRIIKSRFDGSYNSVPTTKVFSSYGGETIVQRPETKVFSSYGGETMFPRPETKVFSSYGGETILPRPETKVFSSYGGETILPQPETKVFSSYGQTVLPPPETKVFSSYGGDSIAPPMTITKSFSSYGGDSLPLPVETKVFSSYGGDSFPAPVETKSFSSYGGSRMIHTPHVKSIKSYGGY